MLDAGTDSYRGEIFLEAESEKQHARGLGNNTKSRKLVYGYFIVAPEFHAMAIKVYLLHTRPQATNLIPIAISTQILYLMFYVLSR